MNQMISNRTGRPAFSGSELVFLRGEHFAPVAGGLTPRVQLLHADIRVKAHELGEAILAAAILGCEASGGISLAVGAKKAFLGLRTVNVLTAEPAGTGAPWPEHSLESNLQGIIRNGPIEVTGLVYRVLVEDESMPWELPAKIVQKGLHSRGLLEVEETRVLKVLKSHRYRLPDSTAALAAQSSLDEVQRLLRNTPSMRPDLWKLLVDQISKGVKQRQKMDESSND